MNRVIATAAACLIVYGVLLIGEVFADVEAFQDTSSMTTLVLRLVAIVAVVVGLLSARRWAWWLGVVLSGLLALAGIVGLGAIAIVGVTEGVPAGRIAYAAASTVLLITAFLLLVSPRGLVLATGEKKETN